MEDYARALFSNGYERETSWLLCVFQRGEPREFVAEVSKRGHARVSRSVGRSTSSPARLESFPFSLLHCFNVTTHLLHFV